jgi:hypothetical protein
MNLQPVSNPYSPLFRAQCTHCGKWDDSFQLAADLDAKAGTFLCWYCQDAVTRHRVGQAASIAFRALTSTQKHTARVALFGLQRTREIEERALLLERSWR